MYYKTNQDFINDKNSEIKIYNKGISKISNVACRIVFKLSRVKIASNQMCTMFNKSSAVIYIRVKNVFYLL